jgi:phospholipase C
MRRIFAAFSTLGTVLLILGCGAIFTVIGAPATVSLPVAPSNPQPTAIAPTPIQHIIVIMQENRSFDHLFNGFPGADTVQSGMSGTTPVPLVRIPLGNGPDVDHSHGSWWAQWNHGKMDGFGATGGGSLPYSYIDASETAPYRTLAGTYTLADRNFQSNTGPSFVAHQYMIAGQSGNVSENPNSSIWGCDAPPGTTAALVGPEGTDLPGVFPCFDYQTIADLLDAKGISWKYYAPASDQSFFLLSAFQAIRHIRYGPDWTDKVISPETSVLADIGAGHLAQVTWVVPAFNTSDHPGAPPQGPDWVASITNAVGQSEFWNSTAIFISWDDWGGWYDHVPPPQVDAMGLGFRVPLIVVSPYAKRQYVSHVTHDSGSILRYIEEIFGLPSLGTRDAMSDDLGDCFDYSQGATPYRRIPTRYTPEFFLSQKPSGPPDDD